MLRKAVFFFLSGAIALTLVVGLLGCGNSGGVAAPIAAAPLSPPPPPPPGVPGGEQTAIASEISQNPVAEKGDGESPPATGESNGGTDSPIREAAQTSTDQLGAAAVEQEVQTVAAQTGEDDNSSNKESDAAKADVAPPGPKTENPFGRRIPVPEFSKQITWLNTKPLTKADLKGKFVLLDFWTYCCINCMHILPELKKLERDFPNNLVVIGVHSAKFASEKDTDNIRDAILRYEIEHPVINDADHSVWGSWGISSWPTIVLIDPEGMAVWGRSGEFKAEEVRKVLTSAIPYYRAERLLNEKPLKFALEVNKEKPTPLRFPGKVLADEKSNRLFISDSNHNRIVITTLDGKLIETIGSGDIGQADGGFQAATFNHPQGCALNGETLYIADTENHMLRKADLKAKTVKTIAGTGNQASNPFPGWVQGEKAGRKRFVGPPLTTDLNSPWALNVHQKELFIAMAGCHQIWMMPLDEKEIGPFAGNGREDIINGTLSPREPFAGGSAFAQPSGLSSDGNWLYVADSEGSSIRKVPFKHGTAEVGTVVGSDHLPTGARLFHFGDRDGPRAEVLLQHCLDVDYLDNKIYVADTYNNKIKVVAKNGDTKTFAGDGKPGSSDGPSDSAQFHEPGGLTHANGKFYVADTNNHLIRTIDVATGKVATLTITGLEAPGKSALAGQ